MQTVLCKPLEEMSFLHSWMFHILCNTGRNKKCIPKEQNTQKSKNYSQKKCISEKYAKRVLLSTNKCIYELKHSLRYYFHFHF